MNNFPKANSFDINLVRSKIMGPNPLKLCEELPSLTLDALGGARDRAASSPMYKLTIYCKGIVYDSTNQVQLWSNLS